MSRHNLKQDALLQAILGLKPADGEDFHVFTIVTDSAEPTWEARKTFIGSYEHAAALCVSALGAMADNSSLKNGARVEFFQGQNARDYLKDSSIEEARYQSERHAEPNN